MEFGDGGVDSQRGDDGIVAEGCDCREDGDCGGSYPQCTSTVLFLGGGDSSDGKRSSGSKGGDGNEVSKDSEGGAADERSVSSKGGYGGEAGRCGTVLPLTC